MKRYWIFVSPGLILLGLFGMWLGHYGEMQTTRQAFDRRDGLEWKTDIALGCTLRPGETFTDGGVACRDYLKWEEAHRKELADKNWSNFKKQIGRLPLTQNVVSVDLGKDSAGGNWVVTLTAVDGKKITYWLDSGTEGGNQVIGVTPY